VSATYCSNCGKKADGGKFCGSCGHALNSATSQEPTEVVQSGWPASTTVLPSPAPIAVPGVTLAGARPRWLVPVLAGGAFALLLIAAVLLLVLSTGGTKTPAFAQQASAPLAGVAAADESLSTKLAAASEESDLTAIADEAAATAAALTSAQGAIGVLASGSDAAVGAALQDAIAADASYVHAVKAAATNLTPFTASAAETAGQQAGQAYQTFAASHPDIDVPAARLFLSAHQLVVLSSELQRATEKKATDTGTLRTYVRSIDSLLRNSAETRSNLGALITDIQNGQIDAAQAAATISSIINQRQDLQNQVSAVAAPSAFRAAADRLRQSLATALEDDYAIQSWINAWYANDVYAYNRAFGRHEDATAKATRAKADFLDLYNRLRNRYLHLPRLDVAY
jgi:hypothetical protein